MRYKHNKQVKLLYKIISECNMHCECCLEKVSIKNRRAKLEKKEIVDNYDYVAERFDINSVILSGGEPTLHSEYFPILDFFLSKNMPLKIITNLLRFSDTNFLNQHKYYFKKNKNWTIYGSFSDIPSEGISSNIRGLENILKEKIPILVIVVVSKDNIAHLPRFIRHISELFAFSKTLLNLELRLIYTEEVPRSVIERAPRDFQEVSDCFGKCMQILSNVNSSVVLWNFPLCYINARYKNIDACVEKRRNIKVVKIDKDYQLQNFKTRDLSSFFFKSRNCAACAYFRHCSGINKSYISEFKFPCLRPLKR